MELELALIGDDRVSGVVTAGEPSDDVAIAGEHVYALRMIFRGGVYGTGQGASSETVEVLPDGLRGSMQVLPVNDVDDRRARRVPTPGRRR